MHGAWLSSHGVERINPKLFLEAGFVEIMRCGGRGKSCPIASTRRGMDGWRTCGFMSDHNRTTGDDNERMFAKEPVYG